MIIKVFTINHLIIGNTFDNDLTFCSLIVSSNTGYKSIKTAKHFLSSQAYSSPEC